MKNKIISIPPNYFYLSLIIDLLFYYLLPQFNLINYSYRWMGLPLLVFGSLLVLYSYWQFSKARTSEKIEKSYSLVIKGLYRYSRNPMYLGAVIFLIGLSIFLGNLISFFIPVVFFLVINYMFIPYEEEKGEKEFGKKYLDYKKRVNRWL